MTPSIAERVQLGSTDLSVNPIGIGCGIKISSDDLAYALDRGINYVFYSGDLHAQTYAPAQEAIRACCARGSKKRDDMILCTASYLCDAEKLFGILLDQMMTLRVDHVDVFCWGWVTAQNQPHDLVRQSHDLLCTQQGRAIIDDFFDTVRQVQDELRCRGYARYLAISTHDRALASALVGNSDVDVLMLRYNIAHRGAESAIFDTMPTSRRQGVVAFNTTHNASPLVDLPHGMPAGKYRPTHADLYRFALERPEVDVVLTGPRNRAEIDHALTALEERPMDERLLDYLRKVGDVQAGRASFALDPEA